MHIGSGWVGGAFIGVFAVAVLFVLAVTVVIVVVVIRNAQRAQQLGHDPLTMQTELAARAIDSEILSPARTIEQRLAEVDDLLKRGVITAAEHKAARARILGEA